MLAVIFELEPIAESKQQYLDIAAELGSQLNAIDGFISIERFESLSQPGKLLSLSFWRDTCFMIIVCGLARSFAITAWNNARQRPPIAWISMAEDERKNAGSLMHGPARR
jgi:heme-degrading monooxygenase HmoA